MTTVNGKTTIQPEGVQTMSAPPGKWYDAGGGLEVETDSTIYRICLSMRLAELAFNAAKKYGLYSSICRVFLLELVTRDIEMYFAVLADIDR